MRVSVAPAATRRASVKDGEPIVHMGRAIATKLVSLLWTVVMITSSPVQVSSSHFEFTNVNGDQFHNHRRVYSNYTVIEGYIVMHGLLLHYIL